jgi:four helix bundle protein
MARDFTELIAWQLAQDLKVLVFTLVERPQIARDGDFVGQITDAARSGPRNIAEGFGRFNR